MNRNDFLRDEFFIHWRIEPTHEQNIYWEHYLEENPQDVEELRAAIKEFENIRRTSDFTKDELLVKERLQKQIRNHRKRKIVGRYYAAASVLLLIAVSVFLTRNGSDNTSQSDISIGEIMNENRIQLLSGNEVVSIGNDSELNLSKKKNNAVIRDSISQKEIELKENHTNKLIVPFGQRTSVILADGSKVFLNSGTEIDFPSAFTGKSREIKVKGEIFIEVARQTDKPFIIHTPNSRIHVLGTSFNVSSYSDDDKESVVLVSGSLEVTSNNQSLILKPNEMAEIKEGTLKSESVDVLEYISWKNGFIQLERTPLNEVLKKIGRYYNIEFKYKSNLNLQSRTCSGKLFLSDELNDVLKAFSQMTALEYIDNNDRTIRVAKKLHSQTTDK